MWKTKQWLMAKQTNCDWINTLKKNNNNEKEKCEKNQYKKYTHRWEFGMTPYIHVTYYLVKMIMTLNEKTVSLKTQKLIMNSLINISNTDPKKCEQKCECMFYKKYPRTYNSATIYFIWSLQTVVLHTL